VTKRQTDVTSELVETGEATVSQIAKLFGTDPKTLPQRMKGIVSVGRRNGYKVYNIAEVASRLVKPGYEIEQYIRQMSPQELSPLLLKEFWNGQRARLTYERELGNYWATADVVELMGVTEQGIRQVMLLAVDDVDREESFTDGQRKAFRRIIDAGITAMKETLTERFKEYYANRPDDRDETGRERLGSQDDHGGRLPEAEEDEEVDI